MNQEKILPHIKLGERNHIEKPLLSHFDRPGWEKNPLMQYLLTCKKHITPLLTEPQEPKA